MVTKKEKALPIPYRLTEATSRRHCVTTNSVDLLKAVLDRRQELYSEVRLRLWKDGFVWTEALPLVMKQQLERGVK